jgi:hypothetical protein
LEDQLALEHVEGLVEVVRVERRAGVVRRDHDLGHGYVAAGLLAAQQDIACEEAPVRRLGPRLVSLSLATLFSSAIVYAGISSAGDRLPRAPKGSAAAVRLKDVKLNIEHNATDKDTGSRGSSTARGGVGSTRAGPMDGVRGSRAAAPLDASD